MDLMPVRSDLVPQPSLVIFDLDGTLLDTLGDIANALEKALVRHHFATPRREQVARMVGDGARVLVARATGNHPDEVDDVLATFLEEYAADPTPETKVIDGAFELLDALAARSVPAVVCTNKPGGLARVIVERMFGSRIATTFGGGDTERLKPDPQPVRAALGGVDPARAWMVGDGAQDVAAARAASVFAIGLRGGYGDVAAADLTIDRLSELQHHLA
jgi:phosphoglycolate phosphatase